MGLTFKEIVDTLKARLGDAGVADAIEGTDETKRDPWIVVKREKLLAFAEALKNDPRLDYDHLSLISAVDFPPKSMEVVYHVDSLSKNQPLVFKVKLPRDNPKVASLVPVWQTADWHEREAFDLVGVTFEGHPNLVRILCAEDWVGHPLRKDYQWPTEYHGVPCGPFGRGAANIPPEWELEGFTTVKE